jgi:hypothetical protein
METKKTEANVKKIDEKDIKKIESKGEIIYNSYEFSDVLRTNKCKDYKELYQLLTSRFELSDFSNNKKVQDAVKIINTEFVLRDTNGYENPSLVVDWLEYINTHKLYDILDIKYFSSRWLLQKQYYIRVQFGRHIGYGQLNKYLKYCYELDRYLTIEKWLKQHILLYTKLLILNKNTIVRLHSGGHILSDTDYNDASCINLEVESFLHRIG